MTGNVFLGLGSNIGDRLKFLSSAVQKISENENCKIIRISSVYESKPLGPENQNDYLNMAIKMETAFDVSGLFDFVKSIEREIGRNKTIRWGAREIDIDILFFDDLIFSGEKIIVPHPEIIHRDFVLLPLKEIDSDFIHPLNNRSISELAEKLQTTYVYNVFGNESLKLEGVNLV